jgi:hypothetical protein
MSSDLPLIQPLQLDQFDDIRNVIEEYRRGEFQKILNWFIGGCVVAILLFLGDAFTSANLTLGSFLIFLILCLLFPCVATWEIDQAYRNFFISILTPEFIKRFNLQTDVKLTYSQFGGILLPTFNQSGLFRNPTQYSSTGLITGNIGKTTFTNANVLAQEIRDTVLSAGAPRKEKITIFNGIFFVADSNKNFKVTTFVVPDNVENVFGHTGHSLQELFARHRFGHCELVSLEDPNFERNFAVYSSDQIEARYLLTPLLMQQISAIQSSWNAPLHIAFIYGKIFLAFETPQEWFEPSSVFSSVTTEVIHAAHRKILMALSLVDELSLNTRIWGRV